MIETKKSNPIHMPKIIGIGTAALIIKFLNIANPNAIDGEVLKILPDNLMYFFDQLTLIFDTSSPFHSRVFGCQKGKIP